MENPNAEEGKGDPQGNDDDDVNIQLLEGQELALIQGQQEENKEGDNSDESVVVSDIDSLYSVKAGDQSTGTNSDQEREVTGEVQQKNRMFLKMGDAQIQKSDDSDNAARKDWGPCKAIDGCYHKMLALFEQKRQDSIDNDRDILDETYEIFVDNFRYLLSAEPQNIIQNGHRVARWLTKADNNLCEKCGNYRYSFKFLQKSDEEFLLGLDNEVTLHHEEIKLSLNEIKDEEAKSASVGNKVSSKDKGSSNQDRGSPSPRGSISSEDFDENNYPGRSGPKSGGTSNHFNDLLYKYSQKSEKTLFRYLKLFYKSDGNDGSRAWLTLMNFRRFREFVKTKIRYPPALPEKVKLQLEIRNKQTFMKLMKLVYNKLDRKELRVILSYLVLKTVDGSQTQAYCYEFRINNIVIKAEPNIPESFKLQKEQQLTKDNAPVQLPPINVSGSEPEPQLIPEKQQQNIIQEEVKEEQQREISQTNLQNPPPLRTKGAIDSELMKLTPVQTYYRIELLQKQRSSLYKTLRATPDTIERKRQQYNFRKQNCLRDQAFIESQDLAFSNLLECENQLEAYIERSLMIQQFNTKQIADLNQKISENQTLQSRQQTEQTDAQAPEQVTQLHNNLQPFLQDWFSNFQGNQQDLFNLQKQILEIVFQTQTGSNQPPQVSQPPEVIQKEQMLELHNKFLHKMRLVQLLQSFSQVEQQKLNDQILNQFSGLMAAAPVKLEDLVEVTQLGNQLKLETVDVSADIQAKSTSAPGEPQQRIDGSDMNQSQPQHIDPQQQLLQQPAHARVDEPIEEEQKYLDIEDSSFMDLLEQDKEKELQYKHSTLPTIITINFTQDMKDQNLLEQILRDISSRENAHMNIGAVSIKQGALQVLEATTQDQQFEMRKFYMVDLRHEHQTLNQPDADPAFLRSIRGIKVIDSFILILRLSKPSNDQLFDALFQDTEVELSILQSLLMLFPMPSLLPRMSFFIVKAKGAKLETPADDRKVQLEITLRLARLCFNYGVKMEGNAKCFFVSEADLSNKDVGQCREQLRQYLTQCQLKKPLALCSEQ